MKLISIEEYAPQTCWDIEVEDSHCFFANGILVHNSNASLAMDKDDNIWFQSRSNVITVEKDNAGFAFFAESKKDILKKFLLDIREKNGFKDETIIIFGEWCGCFYYDTPILLSDGSKRKIGLICNNKEPVEVMSYNFETGKLEPKRVIGWHNNGVTDDWLTINVKRRKRGGKSTRLIVTPNHRIYVKRNGEIIEVNAENLIVGDKVLICGRILSYQVKQFILGSLLGDGSFCSNGIFKVGHSIDNQDGYNKFIKNLLNNIMSSSNNSISGHGSNMFNISTESMAEIKNMYDELYIDSKVKKPTLDYMNKLHPIGLAAWYMDDGSLINNKTDDNSIRHYLCELSTLGFDYDTNCLIRDWFNSHGYECYLVKSKYESGLKYNVRFTVNGSIAFLNVIAPYVINEMNYKLPLCLQSVTKYNWETMASPLDEALIETQILSIEKGNPYKESYKRTRYDLEIEDNHNYFANNVLVHNSNIQKGVAINGLPKMFVIFAVKIVNGESNYYLTYDKISEYKSPENNIYNINDYQTFEIDIDFSKPEEAQNKLVEITNAVEAECPVGKAFGKIGVGEGVVWESYYKGRRYIFKVKGTQHSSSRVKKLAEVDVEKIASIKEFASYVVTENRLNQAIEQVFTCNSIEPDKKHTGTFLTWIANDVAKEEMDTLIENGFEPNDVMPHIKEYARKWFFAELDKKIGL